MASDNNGASSSSPIVIPLYQHEIPLAKEHSVNEYIADCFGVMCAYNVTTPTLSIYLANTQQPAPAVIIFAGGGYSVQAIFHEGEDVAKQFASLGIHAIVAKYRLPNAAISNHYAQLPRVDALAAIDKVHAMAGQYGIDTQKIGVLGFSAGSHLATDVSLAASDKVDYSVLVYGVTVLSDANVKWLEQDLLKRPITSDERTYFNFVERVDKQTPPAFLVHSIDDDVCPYQESTDYYFAQIANGINAELHLYATGGHGFGLGRKQDGTDQWAPLAASFIKRL